MDVSSMPFNIRAANIHTVQNHSLIVLRPQQPNFVEDTYMFPPTHSQSFARNRLALALHFVE